MSNFLEDSLNDSRRASKTIEKGMQSVFGTRNVNQIAKLSIASNASPVIGGIVAALAASVGGISSPGINKIYVFKSLL